MSYTHFIKDQHERELLKKDEEIQNLSFIIKHLSETIEILTRKCKVYEES